MDRMHFDITVDKGAYHGDFEWLMAVLCDRFEEILLDFSAWGRISYKIEIKGSDGD